MKEIDYTAPRRLDEALALLAKHGARARLLAGGTDLIVQLREGTLGRRTGGAEPDVIVDVKRLPELNELGFDPELGLVLGAAVPCVRVAEDARVARHYPALLDAASLIGSIQIQNRASLGGNLCNASPAADGVPPLIALGATCRVAGSKGTRGIAVEEFITGPGRTRLAPDEMLVSLHLPPPRPRSGARYERFTPRHEMDIAVAGAAAYLELERDRETIADARVAVAAVAPTPLLVQEAAAALIGRRAGDAAFEAAAEAARKAARPITDIRGTEWQKRHLVKVLVRRTLVVALERARSLAQEVGDAA